MPASVSLVAALEVPSFVVRIYLCVGHDLMERSPGQYTAVQLQNYFFVFALCSCCAPLSICYSHDYQTSS